MTLEYGTPTVSTTNTHDHVYSTLLGAFAFFLILGMATLISMRLRSGTDPDARFVFLMTLSMEACYFAAILSVLLIRLLLPKYRRWPTLGLNVILLILVPFGSALAIYGFWKVDKHLPKPGG